jgi:hypothetical protein
LFTQRYGSLKSPACSCVYNHIARIIVNVDHSIMRAAVRLRMADRVADCVWLAIPQANEWQRIGDQLDAALIENEDVVRGNYRAIFSIQNEPALMY